MSCVIKHRDTVLKGLLEDLMFAQLTTEIFAVTEPEAEHFIPVDILRSGVFEICFG
jgi:hypothetical protein